MAYRKRQHSITSPHPDQPARKLQRKTMRGTQHLDVKVGSVLDNSTTKPFLETRLGGLAPEIREIIYASLLAFPPPFPGRDFRLGRSPISLTNFVDLGASHLAILRTCRQIYHEAFPKFYAGKAYYLANTQQFIHVFGCVGRHPRVGPNCVRLHTITSLCLKDLVINKPRWTAQQVESLLSDSPYFNRQELEDERVNTLDLQLEWVDLGSMRKLRKVCLCMRVGDEMEYLRFLFKIQGLERGVVDFVDDFHWNIRSQNIVGDDWKLQYAIFYRGFDNPFYRVGKHYEALDYDDVDIQREMLDIDSRASDLEEGDDRWVEVDIGARNYDEYSQLREHRHRVDLARRQDQENQQGLGSEEAVENPPASTSSQVSDHLQESESLEVDSPADAELDRNSEDLHDQLEEENNAPNQASGYPHILADVELNNGPAESDAESQSEAVEGPPPNPQQALQKLTESSSPEDSPSSSLMTTERNSIQSQSEAVEGPLPNPQQSLQKLNGTSSPEESPSSSLMTTERNSIRETKQPSRPVWHSHRYLRACFCVVFLTLALWLFIATLSAEPRNTLGQMLALFLSILLSFAAAAF